MTTATRWLGGIAAAVVALLIVSALIVGAGRSRDAATNAATVMAKAALVAQRAAADSGRLFRAARLRADSAEARFLHSGPGQTAAIGHTDTARVRLEAERDRALAMVRDTAATAAQLRGEVDRLVAVSDSEVTAGKLERDSLTHRIALAVTAIGEKDSTIAHAANTIRADSVSLADLTKEVTDLKAAQPGVLARAGHGIATFAIGAGCGLGVFAILTTPAGPVLAVVAGATGGGICAAVWGARR